MSDELLTIAQPKEPVSRVVVRVVTSMWHDSGAVHIKRDLRFLRRKSSGYNFLEHDCDMVGADDIVPRITSVHSVEDGIYEVVICNEFRDWETGIVEDYDYKLVKMEGAGLRSETVAADSVSGAPKEPK